MRTFLLRGEPAAKVKSFGEMGLEKALLNALRFFLFLRFSGSDAHHIIIIIHLQVVCL